MSILKILFWIMIGYYTYKAFNFIIITFMEKPKRSQTINKEINKEYKEYKEYEELINKLYNEYHQWIEQERIRINQSYTLHQNYRSIVPKEARLASQLFQKPLGSLIRMKDEDLKKLYRAKTKIYHPDHGGNTEIFKDLNNCYEYIKKIKKYNQGEHNE